MEMAGADVHGLLRSIAIDVDPATGFITSVVVEVNGDGHDLIVNGHHVPLPRIDQPFTVPQAGHRADNGRRVAPQWWQTLFISSASGASCGDNGP